MEVYNNERLKSIIGIISTEQKEKEEITEEKEAGLSNDEAVRLQAKEDLRRAKIQNDILEETLKKLRQDRGQRKDFSTKIFDLMCWYLFGVFFIIMLNGFTTMNFHVSDEVILALLGTTAVEVIGTFAFVAKYLYHNK